MHGRDLRDWEATSLTIACAYDGWYEGGEHTRLVIRELGPVYFDEQSLLVHPDHVVRPEPIIPLPERCPKCGNLLPECTCDVPPEPCPKCGKPKEECTCDGPEPKPKRYYGRVTIDAQRVNKDMALIVEEVVQRLTSQVGCEMEISLEIEARKAEGFDEGTVRTISENSRTLKFDHYAFEE